VTEQFTSNNLLNGGLMKRVVVFVCALMVVVASQSTTHAQTAYDFLAELEEYAATHTREDVVAYTQSRIAGMTGEAARSSFTINGVLLSDTFINGVLLSDTLRDLCSSCRRSYNSELVASASLAREMLASNETMSMSDLLICAAGAL